MPEPPDEGDDLDAYAEAVLAFCRERDWEQFHTPKELATGLVTEASELLELFRFLDEEDVAQRMEDPAFRERVRDEVGDALFFLVRFAQAADVDLLEAGGTKLAKSREKYPADEYAGDNWKVLGAEDERRPGEDA
jgi:NTP pyrophosphatase (non-canonical NTP hydrolase)